MNIAVFDLGSITFNLLVAEIDATKYTILHKDRQSVKLGESLGITGRISEQSFGRGVEVLKNYAAVCEKFGIAQRYVLATSTVRNAQNGNEFARVASQITGAEVEIISGEREAELIHKGVMLCTGFPEEPFLIIDIGGGSVEFIFSINKTIAWKRSFEIGIARQLARFRPSNPITEEEINRLQNYIDEELHELYEQQKKHKVDLLVGSSGAFDSLASMILHHYYEPLPEDEIMKYNFNLDDYFNIHEKLLCTTLEERLKFPGLIEMRAEMIVLASILIRRIIEKLGITRMMQSAFSLKEGKMAELMGF